jgi:hypothetical protein
MAAMTSQTASELRGRSVLMVHCQRRLIVAFAFVQLSQLYLNIEQCLPSGNYRSIEIRHKRAVFVNRSPVALRFGKHRVGLLDFNLQELDFVLNVIHVWPLSVCRPPHALDSSSSHVLAASFWRR